MQHLFNKSFIYASCFLLILFSGCRKDLVEPGDPEIIIPGPTVEIESTVFGKVVLTDGRPAANATIQTLDENIITDENGFFRIKNKNFNAEGTLITANLDGYYTAYKFANANTNGDAFIEIKLEEKIRTANGSSSQDLEVVISQEGASLLLRANTIVDESGNSYNGNVNVYTHWYNPSTADFLLTAPGDLRALNSNNESVQLESYGMMAVELLSDNGEQLNIADGQTARLEFPIPTDLTSSAQETILTWSLDEVTGIWIEEGIADRVGDKFITEVGHFSFWNCDYPYPLVNISGQLHDRDGEIISQLRLCFSLKNGSSSGSGYSNTEGYFSGKVPQGEILIMSVKNDCGDVVYENEIGPFESDEDLGIIVIDFPLSDVTIITGTFISCDDPGQQGISNGYILIKEDDKVLSILDINTDGSFVSNLLICESKTITIQGIDIDGLTQSEFITETVEPGSVVNLEPLSACDELEDYISISRDGGPVTIYNDITLVKKNDSDYSILEFNDIVFLAIEFEDAIIGNNIPKSISLNSEDLNNYQCDNDCDDYVTANLATLPTDIGDLLEGNITGELLGGDGLTHAVEISFSLKLDDILSDIQGTVWEDLNENGIRDLNEPTIEGIEITAVNVNDNITLNSRTNETGSYSFSLPINTEHDLVMQLLAHKTTEQNVGDDALDSDFNQFGQIQNIILSDGETLVLDAGLINVVEDCFEFNDITCNGCTEIVVTFGAAPYTVDIPAPGFPMTFGQGGVEICDLAAGTYTATITDASGLECQVTFEMNEILVEDIEIVPTLTCDNGQVSGSLSYNSLDLPPGSVTSFTWTKDGIPLPDNSSSISNVSPGIYLLTVTDFTNCQYEVIYEVPETLITIAGRVWLDDNGAFPNVYEGEDDPLIAPIIIELYDSDNNLVDIYTLSADLNTYAFTNLNPGSYYVKINYSAIYELVIKDFGTDDSIDSDADPVSGETDIIITDNCLEGVLDFGLKTL
jgi:hypothetical protein